MGWICGLPCLCLKEEEHIQWLCWENAPRNPSGHEAGKAWAVIAAASYVSSGGAQARVSGIIGEKKVKACRKALGRGEKVLVIE